MLPEDNVLFKGIDQNDCRRMISCFNADIRKFKSGSRIMDYSDNPDKLGIVLSGTAVMVRYDVNGVRSIMESLDEQSVFGVYFTFTASQRSGIEIMAPSGTFWMAIPSERANAPAMVSPAFPAPSAPAMATPTAIPSGRLCMVTASASMVVRDNLLRGPSGPPLR